MSSNFTKRFGLVAVVTLLSAVSVFGALVSSASNPALSNVPTVTISAVVGGPLGFQFSPNVVTVSPGTKITFNDLTTDGHTLTIVPASAVPKTPTQILKCAILSSSICGMTKAEHFPNGFPSTLPTSCVAPTCIQEVGPHPGLTFVGDSYLVLPSAGLSSVSILVTGTPGTVLHFMCAIHPWMQGEIIIK